ncbi:hypothetical protein [Paenibacillus sp. MSJ-34]|uniref:hypothetical protein n=1 Tax=Paenibacillus sp. MSJ-34 TaxID=2841529 RepID=UPI001C126F1B|nr:hypothetical protein [Paenibacillus sp. MSJ-34]MBU5441195.1 hypothetical protein [Paenibacillus sp. MSJ-34]
MHLPLTQSNKTPISLQNINYRTVADAKTDGCQGPVIVKGFKQTDEHGLTEKSAF